MVVVRFHNSTPSDQEAETPTKNVVCTRSCVVLPKSDLVICIASGEQQGEIMTMRGKRNMHVGTITVMLEWDSRTKKKNRNTNMPRCQYSFQPRRDSQISKAESQMREKRGKGIRNDGVCTGERRGCDDMYESQEPSK